MGTFGIYLANLIEERYKVVASGILGFVIPYLIYKAFVSPKNRTGKPVELEDLEFPRDMKFFLCAFFWGMIMFWAGSQILDLARYLLQTLIRPLA
jgi:hypothetical protein